MAEQTTVARPYAKAAFQFAEEQNDHQQWSDMLAFAAAAISDSVLLNYLDDPKLTSSQRADVFVRVCGDKLNAAGRNFVSLLASNHRLTALPEIARLFELFKADREQRVDVQVTSAFMLSDEQTRNLADAIKRKLNKDVNIQVAEDRSLIGGVVIRTKDLVIDGSVRGKLAKLADTMNS